MWNLAKLNKIRNMHATKYHRNDLLIFCVIYNVQYRMQITYLYHRHTESYLANNLVKEFRKSVFIRRSYNQKSKGLFLLKRCVHAHKRRYTQYNINVRLHVFCETFSPKNIKIQRRLFELQRKMSRVFFSETVYSLY